MAIFHLQYFDCDDVHWHLNFCKDETSHFVSACVWERKRKQTPGFLSTCSYSAKCFVIVSDHWSPLQSSEGHLFHDVPTILAWTLLLHCILLLMRYAIQKSPEKTFPRHCWAQAKEAMPLQRRDKSSLHFQVLTSSLVSSQDIFPSGLRLEQAQITKQVVWQGRVFHFCLKARHVKQIWQNYNGTSEAHPPGTSWMRGTLKDKFLTKQHNPAWRLAAVFNSFQHNRCRAAGADFVATEPEGRLVGYLNSGQGFISCLRATCDLQLQLPCSLRYLPPLRHWGRCVFPKGYKRIKEQETNY